MDSSYFNELEEFFTLEVKPAGNSLVVVGNSSFTGDHHPTCGGIYANEVSGDLSALLEGFDKDSAASSTSPAASLQSYPPEPVSALSNSEQAFPFTFPFNTPHQHTSWDMYGQDTALNGHSSTHQCEPTHATDTLAPPPMPQMDFLAASRPAPGKAPKPSKTNSKKKRSLDKNSCEYRQKRERNNVAVRKSREKTKVRVGDTEKRVQELEEENMHLQSKITLLTKELNVLKGLFTNAGVAQPPSFHLKDEPGAN